jgi:hypothetical protein
MKTTRLAPGLAAVALVVSAAAPAAVDVSGTNPLHPAFYWNRLGMQFTTNDTPVLGRANVSPTNPLHPVFYASKLDNVSWLATAASSNTAMAVDEIRNPLHPKFKR